MDFTRNDERASIRRAGDEWMITYRRPDSPVVEYELVESEDAALRVMRDGGWTPA